MRILADDPAAFPWLGLAGGGAAAPDAAAQALWRRLAPGRGAGVHDFAARDGFWSRGFAVATARESQYDVLRELGAQGALPPGHVFCLAGSGRGCHGRDGRPWIAAAGNLHLSAALAVDLPARVFGPVLPALPALAVLATVRHFAAPQRVTGIKWVNDVMVNGAKIGGVLTALRTRDARIDAVYLGIGLNVAVAPVLPADAGLLPATHLTAAAGRAVGLEDVVGHLLAAVADRLQAAVATGPDSLLAAYRDASVVVGRRVTVQPDAATGASPTTPITGRVAGIGDDLALLLEEGPPLRAGRLLRIED